MLFKWYKVPFAMGWDEWDEWHEETAREHPIQYFFRHTLRIFCSRLWRQLVTDPWYWLKCRVWHRYNVVCQGLPATWCDRDTLLLHVAFQCLTDFIEKERPWEFEATSEKIAELYEGCRVQEWATIRELYVWWLGRRDDYEDHDEDDAMLHKLIDVREYFWT